MAILVKEQLKSQIQEKLVKHGYKLKNHQDEDSQPKCIRIYGYTQKLQEEDKARMIVKGFGEIRRESLFMSQDVNRFIGNQGYYKTNQAQQNEFVLFGVQNLSYIFDVSLLKHHVGLVTTILSMNP